MQGIFWKMRMEEVSHSDSGDKDYTENLQERKVSHGDTEYTENLSVSMLFGLLQPFGHFAQIKSSITPPAKISQEDTELLRFYRREYFRTGARSTRRICQFLCSLVYFSLLRTSFRSKVV